MVISASRCRRGPTALNHSTFPSCINYVLSISRGPGAVESAAPVVAGVRVAVLGGAHQRRDDLALPLLDECDRGSDLAGELRGVVALRPVSL